MFVSLLELRTRSEDHSASSEITEDFCFRARRDKKAFLSEQCKEIEENNRMGKTRDLFKKMRDTKETFHAKMDTIKDRSGMDLTEAEEVTRIHRRIIQKGLNDLDNHDVVIPHLELEILECEVKWTLGSITKSKASGGDRIPAELFKNPKR